MNKTQRPIDIVDFVNFVDFRMADTLPMSINEQFKRLVTGEKIPSDTDSRPMIVLAEGYGYCYLVSEGTLSPASNRSLT